MKITRFVRTAVLTLAGAATGVLAAAPPATAAVSQVEILGGFGLGKVQYGTGCTYTVEITAAPGDGITTVQDWVVVDGRPAYTAGAIGPVTPEPGSPGVFTADWTPNVLGPHLLVAGTGPSGEAQAFVGIGRDFGSVCAALPERLRLPF